MRRTHNGFVAESKQILGLFSPLHGRSLAPLCSPPVTKQQVSYAHVLRTGMTTGNFNTVCFQECCLLGTDAGRRWSETMLLGTDMYLSMFDALFRPKAITVLLYALEQAHTV